VIVVGALPAPYLRVTAPADSSLLELFAFANVTWIPVGLPANDRVKIVLYTTSAHPANYVLTVNHGVPAAAGFYTWKVAVPSSYSVDTMYKLRVSSLSDSRAVGDAPGSFRIACSSGACTR